MQALGLLVSQQCASHGVAPYAAKLYNAMATAADVFLQVAGYGTHNTYLRSPERTVRVQPDQIVESVDASLKRLGTDYIDLLQVGALTWAGRGSRERVCAPG